MHESAEMYLETIYILTRSSTNVRSVDVAEHMGYSKPSVSRAVGLLKKEGCVVTDEDGFLYLTQAGLEMAEMTRDLHGSDFESRFVTTEYEDKFHGKGKNINYVKIVRRSGRTD